MTRCRSFHFCAGLLVVSLIWPASVVAAPADPPAPQPEAPEVSDPMLSPTPPAARVVRSWDEALTLIRSRSPDYISGYESIRRAEAQSRIALAAVLPTLNGQGSYTHQFLTETLPLGGRSVVTPPPNVWAAGAILAVPIINPRGLYGLGTSSRNEDAAKLDYSELRRQITTSAVNAMLSTLTTERVAELNRSGLRAALERLALAQARLKYGQGTELDVDRAQQDVAASRALLIAGDEALRQTREEFGRALGSAEALGVPATLDLEELERAVARTCRLNEDIERRPDVAAARKRVDIADRAIHDAELLLAPSLGAVSQLNYASATSLGPNTTWSLQGVVSVPFYDGGLRYGAIRDARAASEQARQGLVSARLNAIIGSSRAHRAVGVSQASRDVALARRDLAKRIDGRTREGYARGFGTSLDLVTSAQDLRQTEIGLALQDLELGQARAGAVLTNAECLY
jgi:outer membrane protein TolC